MTEAEQKEKKRKEMEINKRVITEESGCVQVCGPVGQAGSGCCYLVYVLNASGEKFRLLDGPPGIGVAIDLPFDVLPKLIDELHDLDVVVRRRAN